MGQISDLQGRYVVIQMLEFVESLSSDLPDTIEWSLEPDPDDPDA